MADSNRFLMVWPLLLATVLPMLYSNFYPLLNQYGGRVALVNPGSAHSTHGSKNNAKCQTFPEGKACEDVRIHHESGTAFLACGYPETRNHFFPPLARFDKESASTYSEYFLKYDIEACFVESNSNKVVPLKIDGWNGDLITHGMEIMKGSDASKIYVFAVNHGRKGESILRFSHKLGSDVLTFEREFTHPLIKSPNAVMPDSLDSFFITNDHYFYPGMLGGFPRKLEDSLGPFNWATGVVHCDASGPTIHCKDVSPPNNHPHANGLLLLDGGKTLAVGDVFNGSTTIYDVDATSKQLTQRKRVTLGAAPDNLSLIPGTDDIAVCVFPEVVGVLNKLSGSNVLDHSITAPAAVLRLVKANDYEPEVLYWDSGELITVLTGAAVDPARKKMVAGGVFERHFIVCELTE